MALNPLSAVAGIFKTVAGAVDEMHTSDEEKLSIKSELMSIQAQVVEQALELERAQIKAASDVIVAEAKSESWITRNWRPICMLTFLVLIVLIAFGWADMDALERTPDRLWTLLTIGIGGYIGAREIGKAAKEKYRAESLIGALKQADET